jgi:two-component sensor histidine kinase
MAAPRAALVLTVSLLVAVCLLSGLLVFQNYRDVMGTAKARSEAAAQIVGAHVTWMMEAVQQSLRRIDDTLGRHPDIFIASSVGDLNAAVVSLPVEVGAWVLDADGRSILTNETSGTEIDVADRGYFEDLKAGSEWVISPLLRGRASDSQVFVVGRRIERDGRFLGAAVIVIPASLLTQFWQTLNLGPYSTASIVRTDGWLIARHPVPPAGMNLKTHVLFTENLSQRPAGAYETVSPADGVGRIVGFYTLPELPLVAVAGISKDAVLAQFWSRLATGAIVAAPIAVALLAVTIWVAVLLRRYEAQSAALAGALEQNTLLFREIHHRVKNNLQTVAALIRLQDIPAETKRELTSRILAMTAVHEQLYLSDNFGELDLAAYVDSLAGKLRASNVATVTVSQSLERIDVDPDRAIPLGLIINEVVQNAIKHAFPGGAGHISITLKRSEPAGATLTIRDDGTGFDPATQDRTGMGTRLVEALSRQIGATIAYTRSGGTTFTMVFPVAA